MKRILITGGGGFVGSAIVRQAQIDGYECVVLGRRNYAHIAELGVECRICDISDRKQVITACKNVDTVIHTAALAGIWGPWSDYYQTNVVGTENILYACQQNDIGRLVYTSTPSVVFNRQDICGGSERLPYATDFLCNYAKSKVMAEQIVLAANSPNLTTCALRPHLVWGPGDPHLIPRIIKQGKNRQLKIVGRGRNLVDISYIDTVAKGHLLAARDLHTRKQAAGKAYFISQGEPVPLWGWINELFSRLGLPLVKKRVPFFMAYAIGSLLEKVHGRFYPEKEPKMTRFVAEQLAKSHYFSISNAQRDFSFYPLCSTEEGMDKLVQWIHETHLLHS